MADPRIISLDTESVGLAERSSDGRSLPPQEFFHPQRLLRQQKVRLQDLNLLYSITIPKRDAPIHELEPGPTFVGDLSNRKDRIHLQKWLIHADTVLGFNLPYDFAMLRADPSFAPFLPQRKHILVDGSVLKYSWSEVVTEKSLKDLGPIMGAYRYDREDTLKSGKRFPSPKDSKAIMYAAEDSHNSMLLCAELARRILADYRPVSTTLNPEGTNAKLSPTYLLYWSNFLHFIIHMTAAGIPMHRPSLEKLQQELIGKAEDAHKSSPVPLEGPGSQKPQDAFVERVVTYVNQNAPLKRLLGVDQVEKHDLFALTPTLGKVSGKYSNRRLLTSLLKETPPDPIRDDMIATLAKWEAHTDAQGLVSKYTAPLLDRKRSKGSKSPFSSCLIRYPFHARGVEITYPSWYPVPQADRGGGDAKGQIQGRKSCANPQAQQFPATIKRTIRSRFVGGSIWGFDLSQAELRVAGLLSGEPSLVTNYQQGGDLHTARAVRVFGPDIINDPHFKSDTNPDEDPRQWCKTFNFEDLYLAGAAVMQAKLFADSGKILPLSFFRDVVADRSRLRPVLTEWQQRLIREAHRDGYLLLPITGHSRTFAGGVPHKPNEIVNFPIQCVAAITMAMIEHELHALTIKRRAPWVLFLDVHDALYADVPCGLVADYKAALQEAFDNVHLRGYWADLCTLYRVNLPLKYEVKALAQ